jgi:16S rRNA G1207 methylase RsmC
MTTKLEILNQVIHLNRDEKDTKMLPYNQADLLVIDTLEISEKDHLAIYHDRFGIFSSLFPGKDKKVIINNFSQKQIISENVQLNSTFEDITWGFPLEQLNWQWTKVMMRLPKSLDLFELYLQQIHRNSDQSIEIAIGFMTKHFTSRILDIAEKYFTTIEQTRARKKARVILLKDPKNIECYSGLIKEWKYNELVLKQYFGVFASNRIDIGTQFLLENFPNNLNKGKVLDLASGNGIIAKYLEYENPNNEYYLMDDSWLAIESSKMNINNPKTQFIWSNSLELDEFKTMKFDLIVSNPPFHFEHENTLNIAINLFEGVHKKLTQNGSFIVVANKHLNYRVYLTKIFGVVKNINENSKFVIYQCNL